MPEMPEHFFLILCILLSGGYMAWNIGANDVANAMGTSVGSGALTLKKAVVIAAILEFGGAFFFGANVSETLQQGIVDPQTFVHTPNLLVYGMLASLLSAGTWLHIASSAGWPVSATHTIIGALVGFGVVVGGIDAIFWKETLTIATSWVLSPILGGILGFFLFSFLRKTIFYAENPVEKTIKITPWIIFIIFCGLSLFSLFEIFPEKFPTLSFFEALIISTSFGLIGFILAKIWLKKITPVFAVPTKTTFSHSELIQALEKSKKYLQKVFLLSQDEVQENAFDLLKKVESFKDQIKKEEDFTTAEYLFIEKVFAFLQIISACLMAFSHGANDVANAIGPISASIEIIKHGKIIENAIVPSWALALGGAGIVLGLATFGWKVIETVGKKITELTPTRGFAAEFGAAFVILCATKLGLPISTTHTLVGAVIGVGLAGGIEALDLNTTRQIVISWFVTIPAGAFLALTFFTLIEWFFDGRSTLWLTLTS